MDADGPRHLGQPTDRGLDIAGRHHHQVGELVDHHQDERQAQVAGGLAVPVGEAKRCLEVAAVEGGVVAGDITEATLRQHVVAALHLLDRPVQGIGRLLGIGDRRREQVGHALVLPHLDPLRIDQDQPHLIRGGTDEDRRDESVDARGLSCTGGTGDEDVRHRRQVEHHRSAVDVPTYGHLERVGGLGRLGRRQDVAEDDDLAFLVGNLDADGPLAGDGGEDPHVRCRQLVGDVLGEVGDA